MLRVSRLTDYGLMLLGHMAIREAHVPVNTRDLAAWSGLPLATVCKVLKTLAREGLLNSHRGAQGGYVLARLPAHITVAEVYSAFEGPFEVTQGSVGGTAVPCAIGVNFERLNDAVRLALAKISLLDMTHSMTDGLKPALRRKP